MIDQIEITYHVACTQERSSTASVDVELKEVNTGKPAKAKADFITSEMLAQQLAERDQVLTRRLSEQSQHFSRMLEQFTSLQSNFDQFQQAALQSSGTTSTTSSSTGVSQSTPL